MNKKFLSAILFGALMVTSTGTFVSCKDYDDEIDDLQEQINKLATKEDMTSQIASLQSALTAAQSEAAAAKASAEDALKKAQEALDNVSAGSDEAAKQAAQAAADAAQAAKDAADAKVEAIKAAQDEVAKVQAELEATIDSKFEAAKSEFAETIAALTKKVEEMTGYTTSMVTSVSLVSSYFGWAEGQTTALTFYTATEVDNTFGPNKELTFTKGTKVEWSDKLLVRVSPTNAVLTPEMVTLINSKGEEFSLAKVTSVKPYDKLITGANYGRSAANNGLWLVETALSSEYDEATFKAATKSQGENILFAVAVSNNGGSRNVISSYDLAVRHDAYKHAHFDFEVAANADADFYPLTDYKNRWGAKDVDYSNAEELRWNTEEAFAVPTDDNTTTDGGDYRYGNPELNVQIGVPFIVKANTPGIKAFYVTLDKDFAEKSSEPSEINIWNEYAKTMTGLNTMSKDGEVAITINNELANRDVIGFRVYAVNYDGTLTDPDGKAFYVAVGNSVAAESVKGEFTYVAKLNNGNTTYSVEGDTLATEVGDWAEKVEKITWTCNEPELKVNGDIPSWGIKLLGADKKEIASIGNGGDVSSIEYKKIKSIAVDINNFAAFIDDYTYTGELNFLDKNNSVIKTVNVSYTKRLPGAPSFLKIKDGQLEGNTLNCFMLPTADEAGRYGTNFKVYASAAVRMNEIFTGWSANTKVTFETSVKKNEAYTEDAEVSYGSLDNDRLTVDAVLVDNETSHATKVEYTYPGISTYFDTVSYTWKSGQKHEVTVKEFNTVYKCIFHAPNYSFAWYTKEELVDMGLMKNTDNLPYAIKDGAPVLTYSLTPTLSDTSNKANWTWQELIKAKSTYFSARYTSNYETFVTKLGYRFDTVAPILPAFYPENARVKSSGNLDQDYFKVAVTEDGGISISVNSEYSQNAPKADVASTLEITGVDYFGHKMTIELPVIVSPGE